MEFFSLLVILTILIIVFSLRSTIQSNHRELEGKIDGLAEELARSWS